MEITIYRRHSDGCKYEDDRYSKRCNCRLWFQYTPQDSDTTRESAGTRSWEKAREKANAMETGGPTKHYTVQDAVDKYLTSLRRKLVTTSLYKPRRMMDMLLKFCESKNI